MPHHIFELVIGSFGDGNRSTGGNQVGIEIGWGLTHRVSHIKQINLIAFGHLAVKQGERWVLKLYLILGVNAAGALQLFLDI